MSQQPPSRPDRPTGWPADWPGVRSGDVQPDRQPGRFATAPVRPRRRPVVVLGSVLALLGLLVGLPAALVALGGAPPLPTRLPDADTLTRTIGVRELLAVLLAVVWLAWLQFVVCTVVEVVAALRGGVLAAPVPLAGPVQRLARGLVAGALLSASLAVQAAAGVAGTAAAAPLPAAAPVSAVLDAGAPALRAVAAPAVPADPAVAEPGPAVPASVLAEAIPAEDLADLVGRKVYVVAPPEGRHHDSLWDIAERHLGDGRRYREIHALNQGRPQPDGQALELARLIRPGWYLVMPEDAVGVERLTEAAVQGTQRSPAVVDDASSGPPALSDPALSDPALSDPALSDPASDPASAPVEQPAAAPVEPAPVDSSPVEPVPVDSSPVEPAPVEPAPALSRPPGPQPVTGAFGPRPVNEVDLVELAPAGAADRADQTDQTGQTGRAGQPDPDQRSGYSAQVAVELAAAGLLGAGLLAALLVARRRGRPVAPPPEAVEAEVWLRVGADAGRARFVDAALRSLAGACREQGRAFPDAYAALADDDEIVLLLGSAQQDPPWPWAPQEAGTRWQLPRRDLPRGGAPAEAPMPCLVALGRDAAGRDVLVDLAAAAGPVSVTGDPVVAVHVVRAFAVELATNPWAGSVRVTAIDLPPTLSAVGENLVAPVDRSDPLAGLRARLDWAALTATPPVEVVVLGRPPDRELADELRRISSLAPLALVVAGMVPGARWWLEVTADGGMYAPDLGLSLVANRIGDETLDRIGDLFEASAGGSEPDPADPVLIDLTAVEDAAAQAPPARPARTRFLRGRAGAAPGPEGSEWYRLVPVPAAAVTDAEWAAAPARVGVLGPVLVRAPGGLEAVLADRTAEVVAHLALHPEGVTPPVLAQALWPRGVRPHVLDGTLARVRSWLGDGPSGPRLREDQELLGLTPDVALDWSVLCTLLQEAGRAAGTSAEPDLLHRALGLVRGPVAGGPSGDGYSWLPRTGLERTVPRVVTAAAHRLCALRLPQDPAAAGDAARRGLRADPCAQLLWRDLLRAEHALWGPDGVRQRTLELCEVLADLGAFPDRTTEELVEHLAPGSLELIVDRAAHPV